MACRNEEFGRGINELKEVVHDTAESAETRILQPTGHPRWICVQIGARDHYAVPRALSRRGDLEGVLTDAWRSAAWMTAFPGVARTLGSRWHPGLAAAQVHAPTLAGIFLELKFCLLRTPGWERIHARNRWFQRWAVRKLERLRNEGGLHNVTTCFAYSYAAKEIFGWCRKHGIRCVLGQVDPGPAEWDIVRCLREAHPEWREKSEPSEAYWDDWKEELRLADEVVVNSEWSTSLMRQILPVRKKPVIIPLAYERDAAAVPLKCATHQPLRVLFLGQICLRKGIHDLIETARSLLDCPVVFDVVGGFAKLPRDLPGNVRFHGRASRADAGLWYENSDVFLLPTHSDGFALTQIEAMSQGLPVIATKHCGEVVIHERNGWIVPVGDPQHLADLIRKLVANPDLLRHASSEALATASGYSLGKLATQLSEIA